MTREELHKQLAQFRQAIRDNDQMDGHRHLEDKMVQWFIANSGDIESALSPPALDPDAQAREAEPDVAAIALANLRVDLGLSPDATVSEISAAIRAKAGRE